MNFNVVTIFPEMISGALKYGVVGQAVTRGEVKLNLVSPRAFTSDLHQTVDDRPFGGGDGMVMTIEPLRKSIQSLGTDTGRRILLSAHGKKWSDAKAREWAASEKNITLVCGRYGGIDQRFINEFIDEEISLGDFILSGGELGALVIIDSVVRFMPGVLGNSESKDMESFADGLLEAPLFTRPQSPEIPKVFLSGDHKKISELRHALALFVTQKKRPDLMTDSHLNEIKAAKKLLSQLTSDELKACGLSKDQLEKSTYE